MLTRLDAIEFSDRKQEFQRLDVNLIAIGFDVSGSNEFQMGAFWGGVLYLDPFYKVYQELDLPRLSKLRSITEAINSGI